MSSGGSARWKLLDIFLALFAAGAGLIGVVIGASVSGAGTEIAALQQQGADCIAYQDWVIRRLQDGMAPVAIATFTVSAVNASLGSPASTGTITSTRGGERVPFYRPCGYTTPDAVLAFVS